MSKIKKKLSSFINKITLPRTKHRIKERVEILIASEHECSVKFLVETITQNQINVYFKRF